MTKFLLLMAVLVPVIRFDAECHAQTYPRWFLDPVDLQCGLTACGYANYYYHKGSSDSAALTNAFENIVRDHYIKIEGGEAYWATEAGVYWMGNNLTETIDSTYFREIASHAKKIAGYSTKALTIVLVCGDSCSISDYSMLSHVQCSDNEPAWIESLPSGEGYFYAIGVAPRYFYESSSWQSAERRARFNLARAVRVQQQSLQKLEGRSGQDVRTELVSAELRNIQVVHRWPDSHGDLFYVLVRAVLR